MFTLLYTGRRWYVALLFKNETFPQNSDAHAYWDDIVLKSVYFISEVTEAYEPTGPLKWFELPSPYSIGNYGPFGLNYQVSQRYECLSVDCEINHVCGLSTITDYCKNETLEDGVTRVGKCDCRASNDEDEYFGVDYYYGHFCEFRNESVSE